MIEVGKNNYLKVNRKTDIGYLLEDNEGNSTVLHFNDCNNIEPIIGSYIDVFVYIDSKGRPSATLHNPILKVGDEGFLKVVGSSNSGIFLNNGIIKDVYMDTKILKDLSPTNYPKIDDMIFCTLKYSTNLIARPLYEPHTKELKTLKLKDKVSGYIIKIDKSGLRVCTKDLNVIYIYKDYIRGEYRLGQMVEATITKEPTNQSNSYYGSLIENKESMISTDSSLIISYLVAHDNVMPLTSDSSASEVYSLLKISNKAFKRALGNLYKRRMVDFVDNKTILLRK